MTLRAFASAVRRCWADRWSTGAVLITCVLGATAITGVAGGVAYGDTGDVLIDSFNVNGTLVQQANAYPVPYVSDCDPGESPPRCGPPAAQWSASHRPVAFCTFVDNLPAWLSADQFRQYVRDAAAVWNSVEAAIGIAYTGDCPGLRWERRDGFNQIAFDDARNVISGSTLGLTESSISWAPPTDPTIRRIDEADIILESSFPTVPVCLLSTLTHELGHALGFGHSTSPDDLMYTSVNLSKPETCHLTPSDSERQRLQELYGVDLTPTVALVMDQAVPVGFPMNLQATFGDPEG